MRNDTAKYGRMCSSPQLPCRAAGECSQSHLLVLSLMLAESAPTLAGRGRLTRAPRAAAVRALLLDLVRHGQKLARHCPHGSRVPWVKVGETNHPFRVSRVGPRTLPEEARGPRGGCHAIPATTLAASVGRSVTILANIHSPATTAARSAVHPVSAMRFLAI